MNQEQFDQLLGKLSIIISKLDAQDNRISQLEHTPVQQTSHVVSKVVTTPVAVPKPVSSSAINPFLHTVVSNKSSSAQYAPEPVQQTKSFRQNLEENASKILGVLGIGGIVLASAFFLKFAFDNGLINESMRVVLGYVGGLALLFGGLRIRNKYTNFGEIIAGGGVIILYLTTYAAHQYYNFISSEVLTLFVMAIITAIVGIVSVRVQAKNLATLAIVGGFWVPFLIFGENNFVTVVFPYILILDVAILAIAYCRSWNKLNYLGFIGTALVILSALVNYTKVDLVPMIIYLSIFSALYLCIGLMDQIKRNIETKNETFAMLIINSLAYFFIVLGLLQDVNSTYTGLFAILVSAVYFTVSYYMFKTNPDNKALNVFLPTTASLFLTIAIPLQFDGSFVSILFFIEALVLYIISFINWQQTMRVFGCVVYMFGFFHYFIYEIFNAEHQAFILNDRFVGGIIAIMTAYILGVLYNRAYKLLPKMDILKTGMLCFFLFAHFMSLFVFTSEIDHYFSIQKQALITTENVEYQQRDHTYGVPQEKTVQIASLESKNNTAVSVFWVLYAIGLIAVGFKRKIRTLRVAGILFFIFTATKIFFIDLWGLGVIYRIISSVVFGIFALVGSYVYSKYQDKN